MERLISAFSDVKSLSELLDGASVDRSRWAPHDGALRLELELTRACRELKTSRRPGLFAKTRVPWVRSRLTLDHVTDVVVQRVSDAPPE